MASEHYSVLPSDHPGHRFELRPFTIRIRCPLLLILLGVCGFALAEDPDNPVQHGELRGTFAQVWQAAYRKAGEKGSIVNASKRDGRFWVLVEYGDIENADCTIRQFAGCDCPRLAGAEAC
jgi:hypothetical protein